MNARTTSAGRPGETRPAKSAPALPTLPALRRPTAPRARRAPSHDQAAVASLALRGVRPVAPAARPLASSATAEAVASARTAQALATRALEAPAPRRPEPLLRTELGDVLRTARQQQGRTLREVSSTARVSLGYLSEVERGQKEASSELLASICTALDVPLANVLLEVSQRMAPAPRAGMLRRDEAATRAAAGADGAAATTSGSETAVETPAASAAPQPAPASAAVVTNSVATSAGRVEGPATRLGIAPLGLDTAASLVTALPETLTLRQIQLPEPIVAA